MEIGRINNQIVGDRSGYTAIAFISNLRKRLIVGSRRKVHLVTDGHTAYFDVIKDVFEDKVHYSQLIKFYDEKTGEVGQWKRAMLGKPNLDETSTSLIERQNLNIRMQNRRFTRKTNAHSKRAEKHFLMLHLYFAYYNFMRVHMTLETAPAVEAGLIDRQFDFDWLIELIDSNAPKPKRPKRYKISK